MLKIHYVEYKKKQKKKTRLFNANVVPYRNLLEQYGQALRTLSKLKEKNVIFPLKRANKYSVVGEIIVVALYVLQSATQMFNVAAGSISYYTI